MTDGGDQATDQGTGSQVPWPPPPAGDWGVGAGHRSAPAGRRSRRLVSTALVVLLTGAVVALAFTVLGGEPDEPDRLFAPVGESIDGGSVDEGTEFGLGTFDTLPAGDEEGELVDPPPESASLDAEAALPYDDEVEALVPIVDGSVILEVDDLQDGIPQGTACDTELTSSIGGARREWTSEDGDVEVKVRIFVTDSPWIAQDVIKRRQTAEFVQCIPEEFRPDGTAATIDGEVLDEAQVVDGDQLELKVLVRWGEVTRLYVWRQVGQYTMAISVSEQREGEGDDLTLTEADELLDQTTEYLGG